MALVIGATSGAVANGLILSKDIKDNTIRSRDIRTSTISNSDIAPGAVNWDKSLDQATKDKITELVGEGGSGGTPGPPGLPGANGAPGADGDGTLAAWSLFDTDSGDSAPLTIPNPMDDPSTPDDDADFPPIDVDLTGYEPASGPLHLDPGSYLVTLRSLSPTLGVWVPQLSTEAPLGGPTASMGVCLSLFLPCETTFPVVVGAGGADLQLFLGDIGGICSCGTADPEASLSAISLGTGAGVTPLAGAPSLNDVVDGLITQVTDLIQGILGPPAKTVPGAMKRLQKQYVR